MDKVKENYNIQKTLAWITVGIFMLKTLAWYLTGSVAILTDTLEYTINVISSFIGLYSLRIAALPRDTNHPYGHGKVEFISAAVEGTLMIVSSGWILYEAISHLQAPAPISKLDEGIYLVAFTAIANGAMGYYAVKKGTRNQSLALIATGRHQQSDTYATAGIIIGLVLMYFTGEPFIDSIVAIVFALIIVVSGYRILRSSLAGIMDEADDALLGKVVSLLNASRRENWVDLHNLRIIKYGAILHLDCHVTVPWFLNVHEAHREVEALDKLVKENFGESVEMFVHTDGCLDFSCKICTKTDCQVRQSPFVRRIEWTVENISSNNKHRAD